MSYNPTFRQPYAGNFDNTSSIFALEIGSDAYVTEREMNELQWIRAEQVANLVREMTKSGVLVFSYDKDLNNNEEFKVINNDKIDGDHLNQVELPPFKSIVNGYLLTNRNYVIERRTVDGEVQETQQTKNIFVELPDPPIAGSRYDVVYMEVWFKELKANSLTSQDQVRKYGKVGKTESSSSVTNTSPIIGNTLVDYPIMDARIQAETSRRIQLQWTLNVYEDYDNVCSDGFKDADGTIKAEVHPLMHTGYADLSVKYELSEHDDKLYIAKNLTKTVNGEAYMIPLFKVFRLNNSGWKSDNLTGGTDYALELGDKNVSSRPDGRYSNIIYNDQITYMTNMAAIGGAQYDKLYLTIAEYYENQFILKNRLRSITYQFENVSNVLRNLGYTLPGIYDVQLYGHKMFRQLGRTLGAIIDEGNRKMVYRKRKYSVGHELAYKDYAVIPTIVEYDYDTLGTIGDMYLTKRDRNYSIYNTGARGIKLDMSALLVDNEVVYSGEANFSGLDGTVITMPFEIETDKHFIHIMPEENSNGRNGEIYVKIINKDIIVYNTGVNTNGKGHMAPTRDNKFQWTVIDMFNDKWQNITYGEIELNGQDGVTIKNGNIGDNYHLMIGTPYFDSSQSVMQGSIGEIYADEEEENIVNIYNTGESGINVQYFICNEVPYAEYYDTLDVTNKHEFDADTYEGYILPEIVTIKK